LVRPSGFWHRICICTLASAELVRRRLENVPVGPLILLTPPIRVLSPQLNPDEGLHDVTRALVSELRPHASRFRVLDFAGPRHVRFGDNPGSPVTVWLEGLNRLLAGPLNSLETLRVVWPFNLIGGSYPDLALTHVAASHVRTLSLSGVSPVLQRYVPSAYSRLEHLYLARVKSNCGPPFNEFVLFLQGVSGLRVLLLDDAIPWSDEFEGDYSIRCFLPLLSTLYVRHHLPTVLEFLRRLDVPTLTTCRLWAQTRAGDIPSFVAHQSRELMRCGAVLRTYAPDTKAGPSYLDVHYRESDCYRLRSIRPPPSSRPRRGLEEATRPRTLEEEHREMLLEFPGHDSAFSTHLDIVVVGFKVHHGSGDVPNHNVGNACVALRPFVADRRNPLPVARLHMSGLHPDLGYYMYGIDAGYVSIDMRQQYMYDWVHEGPGKEHFRAKRIEVWDAMMDSLTRTSLEGLGGEGLDAVEVVLYGIDFM
jgi:hypothetical protein